MRSALWEENSQSHGIVIVAWEVFLSLTAWPCPWMSRELSFKELWLMGDPQETRGICAEGHMSTQHLEIFPQPCSHGEWLHWKNTARGSLNGSRSWNKGRNSQCRGENVRWIDFFLDFPQDLGWKIFMSPIPLCPQVWIPDPESRGSWVVLWRQSLFLKGKISLQRGPSSCGSGTGVSWLYVISVQYYDHGHTPG